MRWIAAFFSSLLLAGCLTAGPGACGSDEAAAFNEIDHFGAEQLTPKDHPLGGCGATFSTDADPAVVVEHYQAVLPASGWTLEDPESLGVSASKGNLTFNIGAEVLDGDEPTTFSIRVGKSDS
jgi:hypothetical protein